MSGKLPGGMALHETKLTIYTILKGDREHKLPRPTGERGWNCYTLKIQSYLRRRRTARPQRANRLRVVLVGSGTMVVKRKYTEPSVLLIS